MVDFPYFVDEEGVIVDNVNLGGQNKKSKFFLSYKRNQSWSRPYLFRSFLQKVFSLMQALSK